MSSKSQSHDPLNSIFQCCLSGLTKESKNAQDPTPGLFKILTLLNNGSSTFNDVNGNENNIFSRSGKANYPKEIYIIDSNTDIASENATNATHLPDEPLEGLLNPQRIGSSIYYDSSDKGDAIAVDSKKSFFGFQKKEKLSSVPSALPGATFDPMFGDCLHGENHKLGKLVIPNERKVHEVYYSVAETHISTKTEKQVTISDGESSPEKSASSESNCISSDEESISKSDSEISESNSTVDTNQETLQIGNYAGAKDEYAIYAKYINSQDETSKQDDNRNIANIKNNHSVLNEPPLSTSTSINDSEIQPSADDVSLYVQQFVGNLSPSSLGSNFSYHDFSHLF